MTAPQAVPPAPLAAPPLRRRLAAFVYEGVLLFGVVMVVGLIYSTATGMRHALHGTSGLQGVLAAALALYFGWFWTHGGQTVAMQAWHIRLVDAAAQPVRWPRALLRHALAWLWFAPALAASALAGLHGGLAITTVAVAGAAAYALLAYLRADRQFFHDALCGTRLVDARAHPRVAATASDNPAP